MISLARVMAVCALAWAFAFACPSVCRAAEDTTPTDSGAEAAAVVPVSPAPDAGAAPESPAPEAGAVPESPPDAADLAAAPAMGAASASAAPAAVDLVSVAFSQTKVETVVAKISEKTGKSIVAKGKTLGQPVTLIVKNQPLEFVLDQIANQKPNWLWIKGDSPGSYEIWDQESYRAEVLPRKVRQKVFVPREITAEEAFKAIQGVMTPNIGTASFDARSNKVIVTDQPEVLELVQRLIEQIDVKFITRVFYIAHADVQGIVDKLTNIKSPAAPAIEFDLKTHLIIVRDRLEIIRQMELLVETLDIGPEMRVYDLNNIGFEGADKSELEEAIQEVLTPDAYYKINTQSGKLIVEDIPEVQEKIEKILKAFDQPPKQVMIQCEIIATQFSEGFNYSVDWTVSGDLFSSVIDGLTGRGVTTGEGTGASVSAGSVPVGSQFGTNSVAANQNTLGFLDFRNEFPIVSAGGSGLNAQYLSKNAYIALKTAMTDSRTRILQQPRVLAMNQKEVSFIVGQQVPFFSGGSGAYNNNNNNNNGYYGSGPVQQRIDVGLQLIIRPVILNNGLVQMEVEFSNSDADKTQELFAGQLYTAIGTRNEELVSTLIIPSGETRVIGGLVSDTRSNSRGGVPGLVKIPVIGPALFGKYDAPEDSNRRRNILIFITPVIVEEHVAAVRKYKGNLLIGEEALEEFTTPSATISDTYMEPLPVDMPDMRAVDEAVMPAPAKSRGMVIEPYDSAAPPSTQPPPIQQYLDEATIYEQPVVDEGMTDLRRVRIADISSTGPGAVVPRGPSGAMTGPGAGTGATAGTAAAAAAPVAATPPPPVAATPGVFRPAGAATAAAPPPPPPAAPPQTETKY